MGIIDLVRLAAQNLWRRKVRTMLTILGVIIGTICIMLMVALGLSNYRQFEEDFMNSQSLTEIEVYASNRGDFTGSEDIKESTIEKFRAIDGVKTATGVMNLTVYIDAGRYEAPWFSLTAIDGDYIKDELDFENGSMFDNSSMVPQIVVGHNVQQEFVKEGEEEQESEMFMEEEQEITLPFDYTTQKLKLYLGEKSMNTGQGQDNNITPSKRYNAEITGVLKNTKDKYCYQAYISLNSAKLILQQNRKVADNMGLKIDSYSNVRVRAESMECVSEIVDEITDMGYEAHSEAQFLESIQEQQARQQGQLVMIGMIALFVSAIGIANTMMTSIMERRREIGVMKVTGLALRKIRRMFLIEAATIGFFGGGVGALVSYIIAFFINNSSGEAEVLGMYFGDGVMLLIPAWLTLAGIGIAVVIGVVAGIYPAWKATKMSPMDAIRG